MTKTKKNIIGIIQARLGSTRLPKKVFREVKGKALLQHMVERLSKSAYLDKVVIATTDNPIDNAIELFAKARGYPCFRGSESDVLDRFYKCATYFKADVIARFCSDCPIIDPCYVDVIIDAFLANEKKASIVCNKMPFTFPDGFDTEVCSMSTLERIWKNAKTVKDREHVLTYAYSHPELFPVKNVEFKGKELFHTHRFTLDYEEDFQCIKEVIDNLYDTNPFFGLKDVIELTEKKPGILDINRSHLPAGVVSLAIDQGHSPRNNKERSAK